MRRLAGPAGNSCYPGIMPATPAWPPASLPRLFVDQPLAGAGEVVIDGAQAHYLASVMRLKPGAAVALCDDLSGEWLGIATDVARRSVTLRLDRQLRPRETVPDLWLVVAPIRKGRLDWVAEKACELGVARLVPVRTRRSVVDKVNGERLRAHMIEAAEQCGRTALPVLADLIPLERLLDDWPGERALIFADEAGGAPVAEAIAAAPAPAAILIGPEGGFDDAERAMIRALPAARPVSLGPRILRADTAAVAAAALWMALAGDWNEKGTLDEIGRV
jgi:16S rRNA (uracil1498-N3)-methyltransferase